MRRMDEEKAVFEQLTLNDFKRLSSTALRTVKNSTIIMTSNSGKMRISWVWCFVSGEFRVVFKHFQNLENLLLNILKEKIGYLLRVCLVRSVFLCTVQTVTIGKAMIKFQYEVHIQIHWYSCALLETIVSY